MKKLELKSEASPFRDIAEKRLQSFAEPLSIGFQRYTDCFMVCPHGTPNQMAAMLEVCTGFKEELESLIRQAVEATQTYWRTCDCKECRESENDPDVLQGIAELMSTLAEKERT